MGNAILFLAIGAAVGAAVAMQINKKKNEDEASLNNDNLNRLNERNSNLESELIQLRNKNNSLSDQLRNNRRSNDETDMDKELVEIELKKYKAKTSTLITEVEKLNIELSQFKNLYEERKREIENLKEQLKNGL